MAAIIPRLSPISKTVSLTKLGETRGDFQPKTRLCPHPTQLAALKSWIYNQELLLIQTSKTGEITNFSSQQFMRLKQQVNECVNISTSSNYLYKARDFKYRSWHPLNVANGLKNRWLKLDKWPLGLKLDVSRLFRATVRYDWPHLCGQKIDLKFGV